MRHWYTMDFKGHYPVGAAAVVSAETEAEARNLLDAELKAHGLRDRSYTLNEMIERGAVVLVSGDY